MTATSAASRLMIAIGALAGLATVVLAAVNAHAVHDAEAHELIATAVQMQGWHAIMLVICGVWAQRGGRLVQVAGAAFAAGLLIFCGDVYLLAFGVRIWGSRRWGVILMLGWLLLAASAFAA